MVSVDEMRAFFRADFPQSTVTIVAVGDGTARVRQAIDERHLRPGGTVSGPVLMATADAAAYAALLGRIGIVPLAVTANLNIAFLRKPRADRALVADAKLLKVGRKLAFIEVVLRSEGPGGPAGPNGEDAADDGDADPDATVAHATATYAIPDDSRS